MPLTHVDTHAALVAIDLQRGIVGRPAGPHDPTDVVQRTADLANAFRARDLPVVFVHVEGRAPGRVDAKADFNPSPDWAELADGLGRQPSDYTVTKMQFGAFYGTALERILRRTGTTQIFLTGISTTIGVESTARQAYDLGFNVVIVEDAMSDTSADNHNHAVAAVFPRFAEVTSSVETLTKLRQSDVGEAS